MRTNNKKAIEQLKQRLIAKKDEAAARAELALQRDNAVEYQRQRETIEDIHRLLKIAGRLRLGRPAPRRKR